MHADQDQSLFYSSQFRLLKAVQGANGPLSKFGGIASSEELDTQGDRLLRKHLDLSYANKRGYVNWDHSRKPEDQLGFVTKAVVIEKNDISKYEDELEVPLAKTVSVYMEGCFYANMAKAQTVIEMLKSVPVGMEGGPGLSVDGGLLRKSDGSIDRALVRGVAITPAPAQADTLCRLLKSIGLSVNEGVEQTGQELQKSGLNFNDAVIWTLRQQPKWPLEVAEKFVKYVFQNHGR